MCRSCAASIPAPNEEKLEPSPSSPTCSATPSSGRRTASSFSACWTRLPTSPSVPPSTTPCCGASKQATYTPIQDEHYALASENYCHFTSPIRRYPDLQVHRLLDRWIKHGTVRRTWRNCTALGDHCSKMERRAETAERELVKLKILLYLSGKLGEQLDAVITGVADYGFFAQAERFPAEGLVHISSLVDDYY